MSFLPEYPEIGLWNPWLFQAESTFHLFYLKRWIGEFGWTAIGHAISSNLVTWQQVPDALHARRAPAWDSGPLLTGSVIRHHDGCVYMLYGSMVDGHQRIGLARSANLYDWERVGDEPVLKPSGLWYETNPVASPLQEVTWRDPHVFYDCVADEYRAFITARASGWHTGGGGCIAVCRSSDLVQWEVMPPVHISEQHVCLDSPGVVQIGGRFYMLYSTAYSYGAFYRTPDPRAVNGTFYLEAESLDGPWRVPPGNNTLLASRESRIDTYGGRVLVHKNDPLFYHVNVSQGRPGGDIRGGLATVKRLECTPSGQLYLGLFGNVPALQDADSPGSDARVRQLHHLTANDHSMRLLDIHRDMHAAVRIAMTEKWGGAGVVVGYDSLPDQGLLVFLNQQTASVEVGTIYARGGRWQRVPPLQSWPAELESGVSHHLGVVVRQRWLDVYLNRRLVGVFSWSLAPYGRVGLYVEDTEAVFADLSFAALDTIHA